jgi:hypothetical protein
VQAKKIMGRAINLSEGRKQDARWRRQADELASALRDHKFCDLLLLNDGESYASAITAFTHERMLLQALAVHMYFLCRATEDSKQEAQTAGAQTKRFIIM